jgi:predicted DNA-binding transcriptional regulator YafY
MSYIEIMRASRLLQMLLLLQNRGRMTCAKLARELEVTRRTVLRDVDALTEAGLPIVVIRGKDGGVELGFNYRTRLTGLAADEAEALAVILSQPVPALDELNVRIAGQQAVAKLLESFPDVTRQHVERARRCFTFAAVPRKAADPRIAAFADAIRNRQIILVQTAASPPHAVHPEKLEFGMRGWIVYDARPSVSPIALCDIGNINVSAKRF